MLQSIDTEIELDRIYCLAPGLQSEGQCIHATYGSGGKEIAVLRPRDLCGTGICKYESVAASVKSSRQCQDIPLSVSAIMIGENTPCDYVIHLQLISNNSAT